MDISAVLDDHRSHETDLDRLRQEIEAKFAEFGIEAPIDELDFEVESQEESGCCEVCYVHSAIYEVGEASLYITTQYPKDPEIVNGNAIPVHRVRVVR